MRASFVAHALVIALAAPSALAQTDTASDANVPPPTEPSASPAPPAESSSSPTPDTANASSSPSPSPEPSASPSPTHRRRHRAPAVVHRRRRRRGPPRARPPVINFVYRLTYIPTDGGGGVTHAGSILIQPFARSRTVSRNVRFSLGVEMAFRDAPVHHNDAILWFTFGLGAQWPGRTVTPYIEGVAFGGVAIRERFQLPQADYALSMGPEIGIDVRAVGFAGIGFAVGGGWTQIGGQWSVGAWGKASLAFW